MSNQPCQCTEGTAGC